MDNSKIIFRILDKSPVYRAELSKLQVLLADDHLRFREPVSLTELKKLNLMTIIEESSANPTGVQLTNSLIASLHCAESIRMPCNNFV